MLSKKQKLGGLIRATRPQFLFTYFVFSLGGLAIGLGQAQGEINIGIALFSVLTVLLGATGVHFRDEAGDWVKGYDKEHGGMGVVREGIFKPETLKIWGALIDLLALGLGILHATLYVILYRNPMLFLVGIPMAIAIIFCNYLTEEIPLGHEIVIASTFWGTILWVYLGQGWSLTLSAFLFSVFGYLIMFAITPYQDLGDYEADKTSGKKTLTAKIGIDAIGNLCFQLSMIAFLVLFTVFLTWFNPLTLDVRL